MKNNPEHLIDKLPLQLELPEIGLTAIFIAAFISATLFPLGSEPALLSLIKLILKLYGQVFWWQQ